MIYISSSSLNASDVLESVKMLSIAGIKNIELSYWGRYSKGLLDSLVKIKDVNGLNFLTHNYFLPVKDEFVLNLASTDETIYRRSLNYAKEAIKASKRMGSDKYAVHAGFLVDMMPQDLGKKIGQRPVADPETAVGRFCGALSELKDAAERSSVKFYVENNVISSANLKEFDGKNPFLLSTFEDYRLLREKVEFNLLLDIGHLKVSSNSLGLDFERQFRQLISASDYLHVSENNSVKDDHLCIKENGDVFRLLSDSNVRNKVIVLETKGDIQDVLGSYRLAQTIQTNGN